MKLSTAAAQLVPLLLLLSAPSPASASYAFYVGKNLTATGAVLLGGTGEEVSSHWLQLFPARDHPANATVTVGVTAQASIPGEPITIPQVAHTHRYLSMEYSDFEGFPAPLTNGGVNERGLAVRDVWATNRDELYYGTPTPQRGVQYSDLARLALERAGTAREAAELVGALVQEHGYATYGGNSHLFADCDEGWVVWEFAGGQRLWAAERLGPDEVRVSYPGYIQDFPLDYATSPDHMGSPNLVSYAVERGWWSEDGGEPFNVFKVYGPQGDNYTARDGGFKYMSQAALEDATLAMAPLTEEKLMRRVRDPRIADDQAGYGQVVSLSADRKDPGLYRLWVAATGSLAAPFVPWYLGVESVPPEFGEHRYLTTGSSSSFLNPGFQLQEASLFAGRLFKRVLYYMCALPEVLHPLVTDMLTAFEAESRADVDGETGGGGGSGDGWVEKSARALIEKGEREAARKLLTHYSHTRGAEALRLGRTMVDALDGYVKLSGQWRDPVGDDINDAGEGDETVNCLVGINPDKPADQQQQKRRRQSGANFGVLAQY